MRKLIASMNITVDGCSDHRLAVADGEHHEYARGLLASAGGLLLGRVTYELFRAHWPPVARGDGYPPSVAAFARELDGKPKYVVSRDRDIRGWNTSLVSGDGLESNIRALRQRVAGDLVVFGSPTLSRSLLEADLIDELHLLFQPFVAGHGPRVFDPLREPTRLEHAGTTAFRSGAFLVRYSPGSGS